MKKGWNKVNTGYKVATCFNKKCGKEIDDTNDGVWMISQLCVSCYYIQRKKELKKEKK